MLYLFLSIACSTSIALLLKTSERKNRNRLTVTTANYVVAATVSLLVLMVEGGELIGTTGRDISIFPFRLWDSGQPPSELHSAFWAVMVGVLGGAAYFAGFMTIQHSIRSNGVALTGAVSKLAILVPMSLSVVFWHNYPNVIQTIGILLALAAILLAHLSGKELKRLGQIDLVLLWMFLSVGLGEFANKLFQEYGFARHKGLFLLLVFFTALIISLVALVRQRQRIQSGDILLGLLVGIPNMLTSLFLIMSFATVPAAVAFPVYGAGTIVLIALGGRILFRERLRKREWVAIGIAVLAVILMQIR